MRLVASLFALLFSFSAWAVVSKDTLPKHAEWISLSSQTTGQTNAFFRRIFEAEATLVKAVLLVTADQRATIYVNSSRVSDVRGFTNATTIDVTTFIRPGKNVLACSVANETGQAAIRAMLELAYADGRQRWVISNNAWLVSPQVTEGWTDVAFPTPEWLAAFPHGAAGLKKWGDPFHAANSPDAYNSWMLARNVDEATSPATIRALPGFQVELLRSAQPGEDSWVALAFDPKGRLTIAREKVGLLRMALTNNRVAQVAVIEETLLECRGLLYAHGSLYVNANNSKGFYRLRDTDGDDLFDEKKLLLKTDGGVGHGRNQITLGPDGLIYLAQGDDVLLPPNLATKSPVQQMMDDQLTPGRGQVAPRTLRRYAQVGHVLQTDRDGTFFHLVAGGLRNPLDVAFNEAGEMFTYDADMERDIAAPWYHPTRVLHLIPGSDFGWRRSMPNLPPYAADVLPSAIDIGVGSPTGVGFGTTSHFPEKYRRAFFIADWSYGRILAVHLAPEGSTYKGSSELFLSGRPLNVTDFTFGPDGAMYFITGGRGTKSGLYRVSYRKDVPTAKEVVRTPAEDQPTIAARALRRKLELFASNLQTQQLNGTETVEAIWSELGDTDRWTRYAARNALEQQPVELWLERAFNEQNRAVSLTALLAVARISGTEMQARLFARILEMLRQPSSDSEKIEILRLVALRLARFGLPTSELAFSLIEELEKFYPSANRSVNHELCRILSCLRSPDFVSKTTALLKRTRNTADLLHYSQFLATIRHPWTLDQHRAFFDALRRAEQEQGGSDYYSAIRSVRKDAASRLAADESQKLANVLMPVQSAPVTLGTVNKTLPFIRDWRLEDFHFSGMRSDPDLKAGQEAFNNIGCALCHRFGNNGGTFGPDLTSVSARFGRKDLLDAILNPSKAIDEKYRSVIITLKDGEQISGLLEREDEESLVLATGTAGEANIQIKKTDIAERRFSDVSPMPVGMLNVLTQNQIFDLLAFMESGATNANVERVPRP